MKYKETKCKAELHCVGIPETETKIMLVKAEMREYVPQERMISKVRPFVLRQQKEPGKVQHFVSAKFPYLQFYCFCFEAAHYCYITGSLKSVFEGGKRRGLSLPNCGTGGSICLGGYVKNVVECVDLFWRKRFTSEKNFPSPEDMLRKDDFNFWFPPYLDIKEHKDSDESPGSPTNYIWKKIDETEVQI